MSEQQSTERKSITAICKASSYELPKTETGKCISVTFKLKGEKPEGFTNPTFKALAHKETWTEADFADDEAYAEVTWEVQPPKEGEESKGPTYWLSKWNGKERAAYVPKAGGNGGRSGGGYTKTPAEIHSSSICGILKTSIEISSTQCNDISDYAQTFDTVANSAIDKYFASIAKVNALAPAPKEAG